MNKKLIGLAALCYAYAIDDPCLYPQSQKTKPKTNKSRDRCLGVTSARRAVHRLNNRRRHRKGR